MRFPIPVAKARDIESMKRESDIPGLIAALRNPDIRIQWEATRALGAIGSDAVPHLIRRLQTRNRQAKLGIIEALGEIGDTRAVEPLIRLLGEPSVEVRWETALALGEIGDPRAIEPLLPGLRDPDRYVRYGTAHALSKLGWTPEKNEDAAFLLLGLQEWSRLRDLGPAAVPALSHALRAHEKTVRVKAVEILGDIGDKSAIPAIIRALRDGDDEVRWKAVLAGPKCGIAPMYLPRGLSRRPRKRKNPTLAAILNFILPGQGYIYIGNWWGNLIFELDVTLTLWLFAIMSTENTFDLLIPLYAIVAIHAWYLARRLPEM